MAYTASDVGTATACCAARRQLSASFSRPLGPQHYLVLQRAMLAADEVGSDVAQQSCHRRIVGRDQCGEAADACGAGTLRQLSQQFDAEPPALPVVHDGDCYVVGLL